MTSRHEAAHTMTFRHSIEIHEYLKKPDLFFIKRNNRGCSDSPGYKTSNVSFQQAVITAKKIEADLDRKTFELPLSIVVMPINKDGEGPETDESKIVTTLYEVWDGNFVACCHHQTREEAEFALAEIERNIKNGTVPIAQAKKV